MSEREKAEQTLVAPASAKKRVLTFIDDFRAASDDADIELRLGKTELGEGALVISIGSKFHALTVSEARKVADIFERAMNELPDDPESKTLPNMILMLRYGLKTIEAAHHDL